ncbi:MAG: class I tRNA ligase family protein [Patescibacteria group bacterium]
MSEEIEPQVKSAKSERARLAEAPAKRAKQEEAILQFWQANKIFEQSLDRPARRGEFVFYEGPPTANARPAVHHLEARAFKDIIPRFKTMQGFRVRRKAGWDTHGLPVELQVEKELGLKSKKEIEDYGVAAFNQKCHDNVWKYIAEWQKFTDRIGYWIDQENPYITYTPDYMESVWWIIKQAEEQGLLYKDYKVLPWCPRCGTALSSHELAQGYKEVKDPAVYVKFKVSRGQKIGDWSVPEGTYFLAWTTTPWTLPGNVALAIGEKIEYVVQQVGDEYLIASRQFASQESQFFAPSDSASPELASPRSSDLLASGSARPLARPVPATQLVGLKYEPLFDFSQLQNDKSHRVYAADFVTTTDGTGIVHTAVMYGADDFELGTKVGLPKFHLVNVEGKFIEETGELAGKFVKDADADIIIDLKKRGLLWKQEKVTHTYPFCWRCQTPLIYYARDSWYIKMSALREALLAENNKINWVPAHIKDGRFGEWLREVKDWAISRERYWGTPLPVWQSADGNERVIIGSLEDLKKHTKKSGNKYFVMRHGEGEHQTAGVYSSSLTDQYHLTVKGREEVRLTAGRLKNSGITKIISSPILRCQETAEIVSKILHLNIETDPRLSELNFGKFAHHQMKEFNNWLEHTPNYFTDTPESGESLLTAKKRFGELLYECEKKYQNEKIIFITHTIGFEALTQIVIGADSKQSEQISRDLSAATAEVRAFDFIPLPHNADYELDLHRPYVDEVELLGAKGEVLKRAPEVLDVWFDSGAMPFAQDHYPFELVDSKPKGILYPADFIAEAIDQTRGWFYTLLAIGIILKRGSPYRNVICLGHILDQTGKKMSKSVGNVVDPWLMMDKYGVDTLRFFMYTVNPPGESKNFDEVAIVEVTRKVTNPLLNVLAFYELYRGQGGVEATKSVSPHALDEWLEIYLAKLIREVTDYLENYQVMETGRLLRDFITDLSQWYLRRSRERIKLGDQTTLATLRHALFTLTQLLAPFMPYLAEEIYQKLRADDDPTSVHLTAWPAANEKLKTKSEKQTVQNAKVLENMQEVRRVVSLALEARAKAGVKVRQPLATLKIRGEAALSSELVELIKEEVNVKKIIWDKNLTNEVELDLTLTEELANEGVVRDFVRQVQDERKKAGLSPPDQINLLVTLPADEMVVLESARGEISRAVGAKEINFQPSDKLEIRLEPI